MELFKLLDYANRDDLPPGKMKVFLDGNEMQMVLQADVRAGYVDYLTNVITGDKFITHRVFGKVEIRSYRQ